jgi:phosphoglycolate phosphatase
VTAYTHILWDWNGTLLNDVDWCLEVINSMLDRRGIKKLQGVEAYRRLFGFPIIDYYRRVGFNFNNEPFEELAEEYIRLYHAGEENFSLFDEAKDALELVRDAGINQAILSASEENNLRAQVGLYNIGNYFHEMVGVSDIYASGKEEIGRAYIARAGIGRAALIGDTAHDCAVARALNIDCVLVSGDHQSKAALNTCGVPVAEDLLGALKMLGL